MIDETGERVTGLYEVASEYIDGLAAQAKTIVAIASPLVDEVAMVVRCFRDAVGAQPSEPLHARDFGSMSLGALGQQVKGYPMASLAVVGALTAAGYYVARRR